MSATQAKRANRKSSTLLSCEHCGAEAQVIADIEDTDFDVIDAIDQWNTEHEKCTQPDALKVITELREYFLDQVNDRALDDITREHPRRPSWDTDAPSQRPTETVSVTRKSIGWVSPQVAIPAFAISGAHKKDGNISCGEVRVRLVQNLTDYEPRLAVSTYFRSEEGWRHQKAMTLWLDEAINLIRVIQTLVDVAQAEAVNER